jgi:hypothetical protein
MSNSGKSLRVRVTDLKTGKSKANVRIPMGMVNFGLKMGARFAPAELEGVDLDQIRVAIESGGTGQIVDVEDEEKGEHVQVFVE